MESTCFVGKWMHRLSLLPLFMESTSKRKIVCYIAFWFVILIRFIMMLFINSRPELGFLVGNFWAGLGPTSMVMIVCDLTYAFLTMMLHLILLFEKGCVLKAFVDNDLESYQRSENVQTLKGDISAKFIKLLKVIFTATDSAVKMFWCLATSILVYLAVVCTSKEENVTAVLIWLLWLVVHFVFSFISGPLIFWTCGLWFIMKQHLIYQIEQIDHILRSPTLKKNLNRLLEKVLEDYVKLSVVIRDFNRFSSKATFVLTQTMTLLNACLLFSYFSCKESNPFFGYIALWVCITLSFMTVCILNAVSLMYIKSQKLSIVVGNVLRKHTKKILLSNMIRLQVMLKNTSDKRHCSLSLTQIDGQICNKLLASRYIFYSMRMTVLLYKLSN